MASMAANFTVGKAKYADVEVEIRAILEKLETYRNELLKCVDDDAAAFSGIGDAYKMPKSTDGEKAARSASIQQALAAAMDVPLRAMRAAVGALGELPRLAEISNKNLISDTGVAAIMLEAATRSAYLNVLINVNSLKNETAVASAKNETAELLKRAAEFSGQTTELVMEGIG
jgi:formiminotetrahydrofolate cyclodeaminase